MHTISSTFKGTSFHELKFFNISLEISNTTSTSAFYWFFYYCYYWYLSSWLKMCFKVIKLLCPLFLSSDKLGLMLPALIVGLCLHVESSLCRWESLCFCLRQKNYFFLFPYSLSSIYYLGTFPLCVFSRVQLFVTLWTVACQTPLSMGIFQARILEWVAMLSSGGSSQPKDWTPVSYISCIGRWVFYH